MRGKIIKHYIYILVLTEKGPKYVTSFGEGNTAYWKDNEKPMLISNREYAEQVALGLTWNGHNAVAVTSAFEIDRHPYNYKHYEIEWKEIKNDKEGTTQDKSGSTDEGL